MKSVHPHDAFFKQAMHHPQVAREFFAMHLPLAIQQQLDLDTLQVQKESFIDNTLGIGHVDMLFKVTFNQGPGYIYTLIEHQSQDDHWMAFRLMKYMVKICDYYFKQHRHKKTKFLPVIYPMIFYTDSEPHKCPLRFIDLFVDPAFMQRVFTEPFQLISVQQIADEEIKQRLYAGLMQYTMKYITAHDILPYLQGVKSLLLAVSEAGNFDYIESILWYTLNKADSTNTEAILNLFKDSVTEEGKDKIMTIADRLRAEGMEQGMQQGVQKGMQQGERRCAEQIACNLISKGHSLAAVAEVTALSLEEVKQLKAKHAH